MDAIGRETFRRLLDAGCSDARLLHAGGMSALGEIDRLLAEVERLRAEAAEATEAENHFGERFTVWVQEMTALRKEVERLRADRDHARYVINAMQYDDVNSNEETFEIAAEYLREHRRPSDHWRVGQPVGEG